MNLSYSDKDFRDHGAHHVLNPASDCRICRDIADIEESAAKVNPQDPASLSLVAEAIGLSFSTEDYAGSVAGLVAKVAKLHADNFSLRAEAALAKSAPPSSLRDGMDRLFDAIGSKDVGECISRLQSWGDERARFRKERDAAWDEIDEQARTIERLSAKNEEMFLERNIAKRRLEQRDNDVAMLREMIRRMKAKAKKKPKKKARAKKR